MTTRIVTIGVVQMAMTADTARNVDHAVELVRDAAARGAGLVLLPELFENLYWCQVQQERFFATAHPVAGESLDHRAQGRGGDARVERAHGVPVPLQLLDGLGTVHGVTAD